MKVKLLKLKSFGYPQNLAQTYDAPKQIYYLGKEPQQWLDKPKIAIVGSRKASLYGLEVTSKLAEAVAEAGCVVISGLAYGVDAAAHKSALAVGGQCVAVLPTPLQNIYPASHHNLARQIIEQGGSLISEYPKAEPVFKTNFMARNRIISGLADAVLITEAAFNSGSLHTARFALEQGRLVMAVPGNINNPGSEGCNNLIKSGALPVTESADIFFAMELKPAKQKAKAIFRGTPEEEQVLQFIIQGIVDQEELAIKTQLNGAEINSVLTILEINGHIKPAGAGQWMAA